MTQKIAEAPDGLEIHGVNMLVRLARYQIGNYLNTRQRYLQTQKRRDKKEEEGWRLYFQKPSRFVWQSLG